VYDHPSRNCVQRRKALFSFYGVRRPCAAFDQAARFTQTRASQAIQNAFFAETANIASQRYFCLSAARCNATTCALPKTVARNRLAISSLHTLRKTWGVAHPNPKKFSIVLEDL
jgi:hypothetical protein